VGAIDAQLGWRTATGADYAMTLDLRRRQPRRWGRS
jgi:hypothetical protein